MKASEITQDSPINVMKKMHLATLENDEKSYLECIYRDKKYDEIAKITVEYNYLNYKFSEKVKEKYGDEGLFRLQDMASGDKDMVIIRFQPRDTPWWNDMEVEYSGNAAHYWDPWLMRQMDFIKIGDKWYGNMPKGMPEIYIEYNTVSAKQMIHALKTCMPLIGKPGMDVDDLRRELGKYVDDIDTLAEKIEHVPGKKVFLRMTTEPMPYKREIPLDDK